MPGPHSKALVEEAALAIASGRSASVFAKKAGIGVRTVQTWLKKPSFRKRVRELRQEMTQQTLGVLTSAATSAAVQLARLTIEGQTEQIRLAAARAVLGELLSVSNHAEIKAEIEELKKGVAAQAKRRAEKRP